MSAAGSVTAATSPPAKPPSTLAARPRSGYWIRDAARVASGWLDGRPAHRRALGAQARAPGLGVCAGVVQTERAAPDRGGELLARGGATARRGPQPPARTRRRPLDRTLGGAPHVLGVRLLHERGHGALLVAAEAGALRAAPYQPRPRRPRRGARRRVGDGPHRKLGHRRQGAGGRAV